MTGSKDRSGTGSLCGSMFLRAIAASVVFMLALSAPHAMALQNEDFKLTASDGEEGDHFGESVSFSGELALVGAWRDEYDTGSAYVLRYDSFSELWIEEAKLTASDGEQVDRFGHDVSISGDLALIGAYWDDGDSLFHSGSAYVFRYDSFSESWIEEAKLTASDGEVEGRFGHAVSLSVDLAIIGSSGDDNNTGSAYVFRYDSISESWIQEAKLTASDGEADDRFGSAVFLSGETALIGAWADYNARGSVYVFRYDSMSESWTEEAKLTASDAATYDRFGYAVSLSGDLALVGAYGDDSNTGSAYVFRYDSLSETWTQEAKLTASDGEANDYFGQAVSLSGDLALIGAYGDDDHTGSAYVFRYDSISESWIEEVKLTASDGEVPDDFGTSLSLVGDLALIGAAGDDGSTGSAYVFSFLPTLDIKCNGLDGNVIIPYGDNVTVTIDINAWNYDGTPVDIWVVAQNPVLKNPFTYGYYGSPRWSPGLNNVYYTGGLIEDFATVVDTTVPGGMWIVWIVVDDNPDGVLNVADVWVYDLVGFVVQP